MCSATEADVAILGASFAGLEALRALSRAGLRVALLDRQRTQGYLPLVHERLVGRLDGAASELDVADVASRHGASFLEVEVQRLDPGGGVLHSRGELRARAVIVALGSSVAPPPSIPGADRFHTLKFGADFDAARQALEGLLRAPMPADLRRVLVVGGGLSGVEVAAELRHAHPDLEVTLADAGPRILPGFTAGIADRAAAHLEAAGVDLRVRTRVEGLHDEGATLTDEVTGDAASLELPCAMALWCGGIRPAPGLAQLGLQRSEDGWVEVDPTLRAHGPSADVPVFCAGDAARVIGANGRWPTMQRAIEAIWAGALAGRNARAALAGKPLTPHVLRADFPHGMSLGARSLVVYGRGRIDQPTLNVWFRRFLMRRYFARYGAGV